MSNDTTGLKLIDDIPKNMSEAAKARVDTGHARKPSRVPPMGLSAAATKDDKLAVMSDFTRAAGVMYIPENEKITVRDPENPGPIYYEIDFDGQQYAARCGSLGWPESGIYEAIGIDPAKLRQMQKWAAKDGKVRKALYDIGRAILFGRIKYREWLSEVVKKRIEEDESPTLAVLAAKQKIGLDWRDKQEDAHDGGPIRVEVTHRILTGEKEIEVAKAEDGEFREVKNVETA